MLYLLRKINLILSYLKFEDNRIWTNLHHFLFPHDYKLSKAIDNFWSIVLSLNLWIKCIHCTLCKYFRREAPLWGHWRNTSRINQPTRGRQNWHKPIRCGQSRWQPTRVRQRPGRPIRIQQGKIQPIRERGWCKYTHVLIRVRVISVASQWLFVYKTLLHPIRM